MSGKSSIKHYGSAMKPVIGIVIGIILTFLYIRFGWTPPVLLQLMNVVKSLPDMVIAESILSNPSATPAQQQRAIITLIKYDDKLYKDIDAEIGFTGMVIRKRVDRKLLLLRNEMKASDRIKKFPNLRDSMTERYGGEDWQKGWYARRIRKDKFLSYHLKQMFPESSIEEIAKELLAESNKPALPR